MNILHLISSGGFYGAERVVVELASFLRSRGEQVEVWVLDSPGAGAVLSALENLEVRCELIPVGRWGLPAVCLRLGRYIRDNQIEIVHSHGYRTDVLAGLVGMVTPVKRIATCHTWYSTSAKLAVYEKIDKLVLRFFQHVVVVSPQLQQEVSAAGIAPHKTTLVFNGTSIDGSHSDQQSVSLRKQYGIGLNSSILLRVGRLDGDKGNDTLLNAFARGFKHQDAFLVFIGEGEEQPRLQELAAALSIEKQIVFAGYQQDVGKYLSLADLFVISSYKEGLPIALLEAMAFGKAIVTTDVGAIKEVIKHQENGWLVRPREVDSLTQALVSIAADGMLAKQLGTGARKSYLSNFTLESMGDRYLGIYRQVVRK